MDDFPPGNGYYFGVGISYGSGGFKAHANFTTNHDLGNNMTGSYGLGVTYHEDFYETGRSGFEFRNSLMLNYDDGNSGGSLGTNFWNGTGELSEFDQRTGMMAYRNGDFNFQYENDGTPFQLIGLGDGGDSFRTAGGSIGYKDVSLNMNLLTGRRDKDSFKKENALPGGKMGIPQGKGKFGERYTHGFVYEKGPRYRYGGLTLNYQGHTVGVNSEWVRHGFQNVLAHDWIQDQRQFEMLSGDWKPVYEANQGFSKFSVWSRK